MNSDFVKLWLGQAVSVFGSLIGRAALPWCAVLTLHATPWQMALLGLANLIPSIVFGVFAGALVDRLPRRTLMLGADILRALLTAIVPLALVTGHLSFGVLLAVAPLLGALSILFDIAYGAYLPSLVGPSALPTANARLAVALSVAELLGFGISGWLFALLGAAGAFWVDAGTFVVSAAALALIRTPEVKAPAEPHESAEAGRGGELGAGLRWVLGQRLIRPLALALVGLALGGELIGVLFTLFVTRDLGLEPKYLGMVYGIGGVTSLLGGVVAPWLGRRFGAGRAAIGGLLAAGVGTIAIPLAPGRPAWASYGLLSVNQCLTDPGWTIFEVHETTLRQTLAPGALLGRVNGVVRVGALVGRLVATLAAGVLATYFGARTTLALGAGIIVATGLLLAASPLRKVRDGIE